MSPHVPAVRPRAMAIALAILLPLLVALIPGVASAQTAPSAGAAATAAPPAAGSPYGVPATPRALPYCNKRIWSSKYMKPDKAKRFVETFVELVKRGKNGSRAFTAASAVTGIGGVAGVAISAIASFAGDYLINYVRDKFLKQFDLYKQVRFEIKVKCKFGFAPVPSIGTRGLLKYR